MELLEEIGMEVASMYDDLRFDGVQRGGGTSHPDMCHFTCLRTGASFIVDSPSDVQDRLQHIRKTFPQIN